MATGLPAGAAYVELFPRLAPTFAGDVEKALKPSLARIGGQLSKVGGDLSRKVSLPLAAGFGFGVVKADELAKGLAEVVTLTGEVGAAGDRAFGEFTTGVRGLSGELGITQGVLTKGLYQALSSGVPRDNVFTFLEVAGKAAIGGVTDTETAVDGLTTVINAFGLNADQAGAVADSLFTTVKGGKTTFAQLSASLFQVAPLASAAGIGFQEVNAAMAALTVQGVPTAQATTQVRAAIQGLLKPSEELDKIYKEHGFKSAADALEQDLAGALDIVADATGGDIGKLTELVGSIEGVQAILGLTGDNAARFTSELDKQADSVGALDAAFGEVDKHRSLDRLKVAGENLAISIGDALLPTLLKLADKGAELAERFAKLSPKTQQIAVAAGVAAIALGPLLTVLGNVLKVASGIVKVGKGTASAITSIGKAGKTGGTKLLEGFRAVPGVLDTVRLRGMYAKDALGSLARSAGSAAAGVARSFAAMAAGAARATASVVVAIARQVAQWVVLAAQSLAAAARVALAWVISMGPIALVIAAVVGLVVAVVKNWDTIKAVTAAVFGAVAGFVTNAIGKVRAVIAGVIGWVRANWPLLLAILTGPIGLAVLAIVRNWEKIKAGAKAAFDAVVGFVSAIPGRIAGFIGSVGQAAGRLGSAIKDKIVAGISGIFSAAGDFGSAIARAVKNVLNVIITKLNDAFDFTLKGPGPLPDLHVNLPDLPRFHRGEAAGYVPGRPGEDVAAIVKAGERVSTPGQDRRSGFGKIADVIRFEGIDRPRAVVDELAWMMATR